MHLDDRKRIEIASLYKAGGTTYQQLADRFGVSKQTIYRIVKNLNKKTNTDPDQTPPPIQTPHRDNSSPGPIDPIEFRRQKLEEIASDIVMMREKGSAHSLPALHRLHLNCFDEYQQLRSETDEEGEIDPEELIATIAHAVSSLPPILRDRLEDLILSSNVVSLESKK